MEEDNKIKIIGGQSKRQKGLRAIEVEYLKIADLQPYENNAKIHTGEQIEQIKQSIIQFGFNDPIAVDEENGVIEGHGRLQAVAEMGWTEVPCIRIKGLTEEQKRAYILVHNKLTLNSDFDFNILDAELAQIQDIEMTDFGFESIEIDESDFDTDFELNADDKPKVRTITLTLSREQYDLAKRCIEERKGIVEDDGLSNENGRAVYAITREWGEDRNAD